VNNRQQNTINAMQCKAISDLAQSPE